MGMSLVSSRNIARAGGPGGNEGTDEQRPGGPVAP